MSAATSVPEYTLETHVEWHAALECARDDVDSIARAIANSCADGEPMSTLKYYLPRYREAKARLEAFHAALQARIAEHDAAAEQIVS